MNIYIIYNIHISESKNRESLLSIPSLRWVNHLKRRSCSVPLALAGEGNFIDEDEEDDLE
jgi:hypothetical protein